MCGICGIVSALPLDGRMIDSAQKMTEGMFHRGPDSTGQFAATHTILSMRRLSIIDLEGGSQPLFNEDRTVTLVANGEIYNFVELRSLLVSKGHTFRTGSDCETIIHLYEEYGSDCVNWLRGMFAFALWDSCRRRLVLARDRMGEKPLYLYDRSGTLVFASEMKGLLQSGLVPFELDPEAVDLYFHYQYVPEPKTPVKGVRKLDAAHILTVEINPWNLKEECYWRMDAVPPMEGDPATKIREELETVSELIIRSDVPVGVALSGGLDSSAIAALAVRKYPGVMHAFSLGYSGSPEVDERKDARDLADHLDMPFHDIELDTAEMVRFFPELVYWRDDPIADISGHSYYAVMKIARESGVPVMLQGQGGDELFWGYPWVREAARQSKTKAAIISNGKSAMASYLGFEFPSSFSRESLHQWARSCGGMRSGWQRFQIHRDSPTDQLFFCDLTSDFQMAARQIQSFYTRAFREQLESSASTFFTLPDPRPEIDVALTRMICDSYLRENGISQADRLSMASSIELRLPLIDYRLVETVIGLRKRQSDLGLPAKSWFKAALRGVLPDWVMNRPKKGFTPPVWDWHRKLFAAYGNTLRHGYLVQSGVLKESVGSRLAEGPFPRGAICPLSFKALVLETWCRQMMPLAQYKEAGGVA